MKWETQAGMPTMGVLYDQMIEKGRELYEIYLMAGHLEADNDAIRARAWHQIAELQEKILAQVQRLSVRRMQ